MKIISKELQQKVDRTFDELWKEVVCDKTGHLDFEKVKRELYDYSLAIQCVSEVYCEITNGSVSKIHADPQSVIRLVYEQMEGVEVVFVGEKSKEVNDLNTTGIVAENLGQR